MHGVFAVGWCGQWFPRDGTGRSTDMALLVRHLVTQRNVYCASGQAGAGLCIQPFVFDLRWSRRDALTLQPQLQVVGACLEPTVSILRPDRGDTRPVQRAPSAAPSIRIVVCRLSDRLVLASGKAAVRSGVLRDTIRSRPPLALHDWSPSRHAGVDPESALACALWVEVRTLAEGDFEHVSSTIAGCAAYRHTADFACDEIFWIVRTHWPT